MDYTLSREALAASEVIYDGCQEQPVDLDISLPDYCPDIQRILKCQVYPRIASRNIVGDRLELEGTYTVKIFYLDSGGASVRCYEAGDSFSSAATLKQSADNALIFAFPRVEYINCRATSPRRLNVHGAFSVCARVVVQGETEVVSNVEGEAVEQKKATLPINRVAGLCQQQFTVDEILELGQGKPDAETIFRANAFVTLQDSKITADHLTLKGEVCVKILYSSGENEEELETMEYAIPFSQTLDCAGIDEDCMCDVKLSVCGMDAQIKNDYSGDRSFFDVQVKVCALAAAYRHAEITIVTDAYSKEYETDVSAKQKTVESLIEPVNDTYVLKGTLDLEGASVSRIFDVWNEMSTVNANYDNGQVLYKGKANLCVLALNGENQPTYFERMLDFEYAHPYSAGTNNVRCAADVNVEGISYRIMGSGIDVKAELKLSADLYAQENLKIITDVTADETKPRAQDKSAALSLYYADAGENLWDIAREYCTSVKAIQLENDLTGEFVENRGMLLIPM